MDIGTGEVRYASAGHNPPLFMAMDSEQKLYSEERLVEVMNRCQGKSAKQLIHTVERALKEFTGGAEQSDDITMLAIQYLGKNSKS